MTNKPLIDANGNPLGRRGLIRSGAIGGAAALLAAGIGTARAAALAPPPVDDKGYPDFSLIKINSEMCIRDSAYSDRHRRTWPAQPLGRTGSRA